MANGRRYKAVQICNELVIKLEKIMDQEEKRSGERPSYRWASVVLNKRIDIAGGLK